MKTWRRVVLGAAAVAACAALAVPLRSRGASCEAPEPERGPIDATAPAGATVARDEIELARLVADGPDEIWLEPKVYRVALTIGRKVAVRGVKGSVIQGPGHGSVVRIVGDDVTLENVVVRGSGQSHVGEDGAIKAKGKGVVVRRVATEDSLFGVSFEQCERCVLEDSRVVGPDLAESMRGDGVKLWEAHDSIVRRNRIERVRDVVVWYSRRVLCEGNVVSGSRYGTHFMYAHDGVARSSRLVGNVVGVFVMYSARLRVEGNVLAGAHGAAGVGIGFKESDGVSIEGNSIVGNTAGVYLDRTPRSPNDPVRFARNVIAVNDLALRFHGPERGLVLEKNDFRSNGALVEVDGGADALGIEVRENHWSDYEGYDLDGDGFGDVSFVPKRLSSSLAEAHPSVRFLHGTVAMGMVDAIERAFPLFAAKPVLVDPRPAMRPHGGTP